MKQGHYEGTKHSGALLYVQSMHKAKLQELTEKLELVSSTMFAEEHRLGSRQATQNCRQTLTLAWTLL